MLQKKKQNLSKKDAFLKAANYCAYQERTQQEVREKLIYEFGQTTDEADDIIVDLIEQNFISEERFAKAFAGGKFRMKKWGKVKIEAELKARKMSAYCIKQALKEIPESDYKKTLFDLLEKKYNALANEENFSKKQKMARFAISKGYESDMVWKLIEDFE